MPSQIAFKEWCDGASYTLSPVKSVFIEQLVSGFQEINAANVTLICQLLKEQNTF